VLDVFVGAAFARRLGRRGRLDVLHARSHVPAAMVLLAGPTWRQPPALVFDVRGLMAEEYEDAGRWARGSAPWRLTKAVEGVAVRRAAAGVVLTERIRRQLFGDRDDVLVIPCCADLDRIEAAAGHREAMRRELGIAHDAPVIAYVGKFTGWYMAREMAQFVARARALAPDLHFLVLTQSDREEIDRELRALGVPESARTLTSAPPERVGEFLAAADAALSFIQPSPSKASSSPTKVGEYLAAGLPIACTAGVGDLDAQITPDIGVLVAAHDEPAHLAAAERLLALARDPDTAERCRAAAHRLFSLQEVGVPRYRALYDRVARKLAQ
jgi:glycosyltransferase involved in cell wall biosynthesis